MVDKIGKPLSGAEIMERFNEIATTFNETMAEYGEMSGTVDSNVEKITAIEGRLASIETKISALVKTLTFENGAIKIVTDGGSTSTVTIPLATENTNGLLSSADYSWIQGEK